MISLERETILPCFEQKAASAEDPSTQRSPLGRATPASPPTALNTSQASLTQSCQGGHTQPSSTQKIHSVSGK